MLDATLVSGQMAGFSTSSPFQEAGYQYDLTQTTLDRLSTLYLRMLERMAFFCDNIEKLRPARPAAARPVARPQSQADGVALEA